MAQTDYKNEPFFTAATIVGGKVNTECTSSENKKKASSSHPEFYY
jgi:hypothetical protein